MLPSATSADLRLDGIRFYYQYPLNATLAIAGLDLAILDTAVIIHTGFYDTG